MMQNKQEGFTTKMCKSTECDDYGQILSNTQFCSVYFTIGNSVVLLIASKVTVSCFLQQRKRSILVESESRNLVTPRRCLFEPYLENQFMKNQSRRCISAFIEKCLPKLIPSFAAFLSDKSCIFRQRSSRSRSLFFSLKNSMKSCSKRTLGMSPHRCLSALQLAVRSSNSLLFISINVLRTLYTSATIVWFQCSLLILQRVLHRAYYVVNH